MGLQCMFAAYGGTVDRVGEIVHGKTSVLKHDGKGLFRGIRNDINGTRYHSLAGTLGTLPEELEVTCRTPRLDISKGDKEGIVMGIRHKTLTMEAVQYHPESILSEEGQQMLANFLQLRGGKWEENAGFGLSDKERQQEATPTRPPKVVNGSAPTILDRIYAQRRRDVAQAKATPGTYPSDLSTFLDMHLSPPLINFYDRICQPVTPVASTSTSTPPTKHVALMAEMKRASPSKGDILPANSPLTSASIGLSYAQAGASVISVLTEPTWFKGTLNDMLAVRNAISTLSNRPAVLRKDFVFDTYQIDEARYYGADTVLLIVAMLSDEELKELYDYARFVRGMEPLVEVNNAEELERALKVGAKIIGVNNRNLHDFNVDMSTTSRIAEVISEQSQKYSARAGPGGMKDDRAVILCALSGITGREDVVRYTEQGVGAVLVGESLMRADDKPSFVRSLLGLDAGATNVLRKKRNSLSRPQLTGPPDGFAIAETPVADSQLGSAVTARSGPGQSSYKPLVKICGIKTPEAALTAADAGADFIGLIFVPKSKRCVSLQEAKAVVDAVRSGQTAARAVPGNGSEMPATDFFAIQSARLATSRRKPLVVGVFQNQSLEVVQQAVDYLNLDIVQLHGSEPAEWCRLLAVPTFRAFHVDEAHASEEAHSLSSQAGSSTRLALSEATRPGYHSIPLLDTKVMGSAVSGGAGKSFDWSIARKLVQEKGQPLVLAGGLEVGNVAGAVSMVRPWAVDVCGGVETEGKKDLGKIRAFIKAANGGSL